MGLTYDCHTWPLSVLYGALSGLCSPSAFEVQRADYTTVTSGGEHDIWVLYVPNIVNINGDAGHRHGHGTEAAQTIWHQTAQQ